MGICIGFRIQSDSVIIGMGNTVAEAVGDFERRANDWLRLDHPDEEDFQKNKLDLKGNLMAWFRDVVQNATDDGLDMDDNTWIVTDELRLFDTWLGDSDDATP